MAQAEQTRLYFRGETTNDYIDLSAALTAANRKQYHQTTRKGDPMAYAFTITAINGTVVVDGAQNTFCTSNAVKMTCAGHAAQLRHAGISMKDLSTYGRHCRFALETAAYRQDTVNFTESPEGGFIASNLSLPPRVDSNGDMYFSDSGYLASNGKTIVYRDQGDTTIPLGEICANMITTVIVGDQAEEPLVLLGHNGTGEFNVISNYRSGRVSSPDVDVGDTIPDGDMATLFSVSEEASDEISDAAEDFMDYKPYVPDDETNDEFRSLTRLCKVSSTTSATSQYPYTAAQAIAPLGLLKIRNAVDVDFIIDVEAIYEM